MRVSCFLFILFYIFTGVVWGSDEYSFDLDEFEKKSFEIGGYAELKYEHINLRRGAAAALLTYYQDPLANLDRLSAAMQLQGNFNKGAVDFNWLLQGSGQQDQTGWSDNLDIFAAYASIKPTPMVTLDLGKKVLKWGKGYAWNPVGFIDRPKDPNNPEEALEGYIGASLDLIKSFSGPLQTAALTTVALPVWQGVNEDFGAVHNINLAAKLYLLYLDTDIDFIWYTGNSRSTRYGFDISRNLATNFEIHAEISHIPSKKVQVLLEDGSIIGRESSDTSYLLGLRYLSQNDITTIVEYYHNGDGYSEVEQDRFYQLVDDAYDHFLSSADVNLFQKASSLAASGYNKPQPGKNYLYAKVTIKEPFDLLYFTPGFTAIMNVDDTSYSLSPEAVYSGFTNWEMRLRFSLINGGHYTENGEKANKSKLEFRVRYFF